MTYEQIDALYDTLCDAEKLWKALWVDFPVGDTNSEYEENEKNRDADPRMEQWQRFCDKAEEIIGDSDDYDISLFEKCSRKKFRIEMIRNGHLTCPTCGGLGYKGECNDIR